MEITFRRITQEDKNEWFRMRKGIWPEAPDEYLNFDMDDILANENYFAVFACDGDQPVGLTEAQIREYGEGCETSPVAYVEGWFVREDYRGKNILGIMNQAAENWAREKGCTEMASDTWLDNEASIRAHLKLGYVEAERLIHYVKQL